MPPVELGFLQQCESWQLESRLFPSKVGGKPAWLSLSTLPSAEELKCKKCERTMIFLCQIYAPYEDCVEGSDMWINNFHRIVYVFICRNPGCNERNSSENIVVFRSNIQRKNNFYHYDPPKNQPDSSFDLTKFCSLCNACGIAANKRCSRCKKIFYCTREHQVKDWKKGHKQACLSEVNTVIIQSPLNILFPEWEIITETEMIEKDEIDEEKELEKFEELKIEGKTGTLQDVPESELSSHASSEVDKTFMRFKKHIYFYPDQVIRYSRGGEPLFIANKPLPTSIPNCEVCNGPRQFEFQIMPQILSELEEHDLDFGVLLIYSCKLSCVGSSQDSYKKEFVFKQDVSLDSDF